MSEDLHDIDDLFRGGLEGHEEGVPSSVWEAVNNDLNQKQASYYKSKYRRLKRAAVLLLLLCLLGGVYVVVDVRNHKQQPITDSTAGENLRSSTRVGENKKEPSSSRDQFNSARKNADEISTADTTYHQPSSLTTNSFPVEKKPTPFDEQAIQSENNKHSSALPILGIANQRRNNSNLTFENSDRKQKVNLISANENQTGFTTTNSLPIKEKPAILQYFALPEMNLSLSDISFEALSKKPYTISLPAKKKAKAAAHGFSLSAFAAPNFSFDRLEDDNHLAGPGHDRQDAHRNEQEDFSFSGGLLLNYALSQKLSVQTGITLTTSSTSIAPKTVYAKADNSGHTHYELNCSSGYVYISPKGIAQPVVGDSAMASGTTSRLTYVGVPVIASYHIAAGRFSLLPSVGAGVNFLTSGKTSTLLSKAAATENSTTNISGLKSTYVDGHFGLGIEYGLTKKIAVSLRPNARLALTPINKETPVKSYQNFLSVEAGVRINL